MRALEVVPLKGGRSHRESGHSSHHFVNAGSGLPEKGTGTSLSLGASPLFLASPGTRVKAAPSRSARSAGWFSRNERHAAASRGISSPSHKASRSRSTRSTTILYDLLRLVVSSIPSHAAIRLLHHGPARRQKPREQLLRLELHVEHAALRKRRLPAVEIPLQEGKPRGVGGGGRGGERGKANHP